MSQRWRLLGLYGSAAPKNPKMETGDIEVVPSKVTVLGKCQYNELPFQIDHSKEADENTRLKYRYLDLRNPAVKAKIVLRSKIVADLRAAMIAHDFMEITTPILTCSSPEGARDYLVPSRNHPGNFMRFRRHRSSLNNCLWHLDLTAISR